MTTMYNDYWGLREKPFEPGAGEGYYYPAESHQGALLKLRYAVESRRGAALLTGPAGSGKTLLVRALRRQLAEDFQPFVHLVFPRMTPGELLSYIAIGLEAESSQYEPRMSVDQCILRIERRLAEIAEAGRHAVIVIDEAHLLADTENLETMRLLLNFESDSGSGLTLILAGQHALLPALSRMPSLEQRLSVKTMLRPLTVDETASYITHRLSAAGASRRIFGTKAIEAVHELSQGAPRQINRLCDLALLVGFAESLESIDADQIDSVSDELLAATPE
ncbi:MAG: AAA family ATPase [Pirellulales bacterium]